MPKHYKLTWEIDVWADDHIDAAFQAEKLMKQQAESDSTGPYFKVENVDTGGYEGDIDLEEFYSD